MVQIDAEVLARYNTYLQNVDRFLTGSKIHLAENPRRAAEMLMRAADLLVSCERDLKLFEHTEKTAMHLLQILRNVQKARELIEKLQKGRKEVLRELETHLEMAHAELRICLQSFAKK